MSVPIICLDDELCHFVEGYRPLLSKPQYQYFVDPVGQGNLNYGGNTRIPAVCSHSLNCPAIPLELLEKTIILSVYFLKWTILWSVVFRSHRNIRG